MNEVIQYPHPKLLNQQVKLPKSTLEASLGILASEKFVAYSSPEVIYFDSHGSSLGIGNLPSKETDESSVKYLPNAIKMLAYFYGHPGLVRHEPAIEFVWGDTHARGDLYKVAISNINKLPTFVDQVENMRQTEATVFIPWTAVQRLHPDCASIALPFPGTQHAIEHYSREFGMNLHPLFHFYAFRGVDGNQHIVEKIIDPHEYHLLVHLLLSQRADHEVSVNGLMQLGVMKMASLKGYVTRINHLLTMFASRNENLIQIASRSNESLFLTVLQKKKTFGINKFSASSQ